MGAVVHTIGVGSESEPPEAAIVKVEHPDAVASDGTLTGNILTNQFGLDGSEFNLRIESASTGEVVWQSSAIATSNATQSIPFSIDVESVLASLDSDSPRGVRVSTIVMDLRAVLDPVQGDRTIENNRVSFRVAASTRDRRMLILDGSSRWEMRYVRNVFSRDPSWSVDTILYGPGTDDLRLKRGNEPGEFPQTREAMGRYDVIVLGEIPPEQFDASDASVIREFVTRGGGLIVIDGRFNRVARLANDFLSDLVPVRFVEPEIVSIGSIQPTRLGFEQSVFKLGNEQTNLEELWSQLPPPQSAVDVELQEGAESWADVVRPDSSRSPWLATRLFGAGRVFYLSSDQSWRWRYKVADRFHARFWNQLVAAAMQPPYSASDEYVSLGTDRIEYLPGQSPLIRARLQDTEGKPVGDATVDAVVISDNEIVAIVPMSIDDPARGTYRASTGQLAEGSYQVRVPRQRL